MKRMCTFCRGPAVALVSGYGLKGYRCWPCLECIVRVIKKEGPGVESIEVVFLSDRQKNLPVPK